MNSSVNSFSGSEKIATVLPAPSLYMKRFQADHFLGSRPPPSTCSTTFLFSVSVVGGVLILFGSNF